VIRAMNQATDVSNEKSIKSGASLFVPSRSSPVPSKPQNARRRLQLFRVPFRQCNKPHTAETICGLNVVEPCCKFVQLAGCQTANAINRPNKHPHQNRKKWACIFSLSALPDGACSHAADATGTERRDSFALTTPTQSKSNRISS
jgi:hypothetical protein